MTRIQTRLYKPRARRALADPVLRAALSNMQNRLGPATAQTYRDLPEGPALRQKAHEMRKFSIQNLDLLLETLARKIRDRGGQVFFAQTAREAADYCLRVAQKNGVRHVVKGKSMVTEEIGLNQALQAEGIETVETDLGEYIIQLAGESPSHILAPAIHKTRGQVAELFTEKLGIPYCEDPPTLTLAARKALRKKFLTADMGLSGCNLACAETGHITTLSNEGNIRMATTLPRLHMAFMGMERITACLSDHDVLFRLLSRGAAAQNLAGCVSYIGGPRAPGHTDGPDEFHLVILDNGRSRILSDPEFREALYCIRCGACLNVCPAYGKIGGHAYGFPYSGPIGAVITPLLTGIERARDLPRGEPLCGACKQACPVDIDLPRMLLALRARLAQGDPDWGVSPVSPAESLAFKIWALLARSPKAYGLALKSCARVQSFFPRTGGMIRRMPGLHAWTRTRDLVPLAPTRFLDTLKKRNPTP